MFNQEYFNLFAQSMRLKDWGLLKSSLAKREEATQLMRNDAGYYAIGKANEATLLGHHIGDGLGAYEATKESLKNIKTFAEADAEWKANTGFSLLNDCLGFVQNWAESYEEMISYWELTHQWANLHKNAGKLEQQVRDFQAKGREWWEVQRTIAYSFYSRETAERDAGKHASAMAILHCIIDRTCRERQGYEMNLDEIFDVLDDYIMLTLQAYGVIFQKFRTALNSGAPLAHVDGAAEQFIIFKNPLKYWLQLMPDCPEKVKRTFQIYYEMIMKMPFLPFPDIMRQIGAFFPDTIVEKKACKYCGHENSTITSLCVKCGRPFDDSAMASQSDIKSTLRIDKVPFNPAESAMPKTTEQQQSIKFPKNDHKKAMPLGCAIPQLLVYLAISVYMWYWALDNMVWYKIFLAIIVSFFTLSFILMGFRKIPIQQSFGRDAFEGDIENARKGNVHAMVNVGLAYWRGDGVEQDLGQAEYWLSLAVSRGNLPARYALNRLKSDPDNPIII